MYHIQNLDNRICDVEPGTTNIQTYREWIHDISFYIFGKDLYPDEKLNALSDLEFTEVIEELDWLADK